MSFSDLPAYALDRGRGPMLALAGWFSPARLVFFGWVLILPGLVWRFTPGLSEDGRLALCVLLVAVGGWVLTRLGDTLVALVAALVLVIGGGARPEMLYATLGSELIWLLVAAFVIAAAVKASGLVDVTLVPLVRRARSVTALFHLLSAAIAATAFVIPSTSGRAALLLPVFLVLADRLGDRAQVRGLALLFPTAILLSAAGSLTGAGAHLVAVDTIARLGGPRLGFIEWLALVGPLALLTTHAATQIILWTSLDAAERSRPLDLAGLERPTVTAQQRNLGVVLLVIVGLWISEPWHGLGLALVAVVGMVAATWPGLAPVKLKAALKAVEWDLLIFMAMTLMLGRALIDSDADEWVVQQVMGVLGEAAQSARWVVLALLALIALSAHLLITSRTARAMVLIPSLAVPVAGLGIDPTVAILVIVTGTGFCQTLAASAKPVALFAGLERETYEPRDLVRLSGWLALPMLAAILAFALLWWPVALQALRSIA